MYTSTGKYHRRGASPKLRVTHASTHALPDFPIRLASVVQLLKRTKGDWQRGESNPISKPAWVLPSNQATNIGNDSDQRGSARDNHAIGVDNDRGNRGQGLVPRGWIKDMGELQSSNMKQESRLVKSLVKRDEQGELRQPTPREPQQRTKLQRLSKAELVRLHDHLQSVGQGNSLRFQHVCNELAKR